MDRSGLTLEDVLGSFLLGEVDGREVELDEDFVDAFFHEGGVGRLSGTEFGRVDTASIAAHGAFGRVFRGCRFR